MCGKLDCYMQQFAKLRVDANRKYWPVQTGHRSPYKPLLLLSVCDLIATGSLVKNFIEPSYELAETFTGYRDLVLPDGPSGSMAYPFYHLFTSEFWRPVCQPGKEHLTGLTVSSVKRLRELYLGARLADDLFPLLQMATSRDALRNVLLTTYFDKKTQELLTQQGVINYDVAKYSNSLTHTSEIKFDFEIAAAPKVRDQGFRKTIVGIYQHRCALCGIRMRSPEGRTAVDAAHIVPWSESRDDHPTNGLSLCKLCHWSFDYGLMSVNKGYEVLVSPAVSQEENLPGHILTLRDRPIFKPAESRYWPAEEKLAWHRAKRFKAA